MDADIQVNTANLPAGFLEEFKHLLTKYSSIKVEYTEQAPNKRFRNDTGHEATLHLSVASTSSTPPLPSFMSSQATSSFSSHSIPSSPLLSVLPIPPPLSLTIVITTPTITVPSVPSSAVDPSASVVSSSSVRSSSIPSTTSTVIFRTPGLVWLQSPSSTSSSSSITPHPTNSPDPSLPVYCPTCFQTPCVTQQSHTWLRGSASPTLGNIAKRYKLYRRFWSLLNRLSVWNHPTYEAIKATKTSSDDPREVMILEKL